MQTLNDMQLEVLSNLEHFMSKRYKVISTQSVVDRFIERGFEVKSVTLPKGKNKRGVHIVRLTRPDLLIETVTPTGVKAAEQIEVLIVNSYNGGSSLKLNLGIYRFVCSNGLIAGTDVFKTRICHVGKDFYEQVDHGIAAILKQLPKLKSIVTRLKQRTVTPIERALFAQHCYSERLKGNKKLFYIDLEQSLNPVRTGDLGNDLWTVLNIIQERVIRGGIKFATIEGEADSPYCNIWEHNKTRAINSIAEQLRLNEFMFDAALKIAA